VAADFWAGQGRSSFLKKRTKKLLHIGLGLSGEAEVTIQKFFAAFFQKRRVFLRFP
jgi:hypothetical protein